MRLSRHEEQKLITQGIGAIAVCVAIVAAAIYFPHTKTKELISQADNARLTNSATHLDNVTVAKEITYLRENEKAIETLWASLRGWGNGVRLENVDPLMIGGLDTHLPIPPAKIPGNSIQYSGVQLSGERTEFQRMMVALNDVETKQGLIQVRQATLKLPVNSDPNGLRPTFLNITLEIVAPSSK